MVPCMIQDCPNPWHKRARPAGQMACFDVSHDNMPVLDTKSPSLHAPSASDMKAKPPALATGFWPLLHWTIKGDLIADTTRK